MVTVKFHGDLKRFSNTPIELCVENFSELMSGLLTQIQGLRQHLRQGYYKVRIGRDRYFSEAQIKSNAALPLDENCTVHFTPVVAGAGKGGGLQMILGAVLIAVAYFNPFGYLTGPMVSAMYAAGASMIIGGAMQMLSRPPEMNSKLGDSEKQQSTSFSNLRNLTPQGRPIPLLYGEMMSSMVLISQGVDTFDAMSEQDKAELEKLRQQESASAAIIGRVLNQRERTAAERAEEARQAREERAREREEARAERERERERERFERKERQGQHMII